MTDLKSTSFDSLIFDMDGTLWDAVDTYAEIWNQTYRQMGVNAHVDRQTLIDLMGTPIDGIIKAIAPKGLDVERFSKILRQVDRELLPTMGGHLYDGVDRLIPLLAKHYRLFMVSNCGRDGLSYFLQFTSLAPYFTDTLSHGQTLLPKEGNIKLLVDRYNLKSPVYIGDTQGDCRSAHAAAIPMIFAKYGFGHCDDADFSIESFDKLSSLLPSNT